jgi:hypothetical protein
MASLKIVDSTHFLGTLRPTVDDLMDRAMSALIANDPRRGADVALTLLLSNVGAPAGCVYRCAGARLELWVSRGIDQLDLERVAATWDDARESVLAGHAFLDNEYSLMPVVEQNDNGHVLGVVYVGSRRPIRVEASVTTALMPLFRNALSVAADAPRESFDDYLQSVSPEQVARHQLTVLLDRHEWNIARVARVLRVERATVYSRMQRYGIPRKRVRKT